MKRYKDLIDEALLRVREIQPWDLVKQQDYLLLDVREPAEFDRLHIPGSINVPRGILEQSCEWDYDETVPELVTARSRPVAVICRSGYRSVLAADVMQQMGYTNVISLKTGVRGWNDAELPLQNILGQQVDADAADEILMTRVRADQRKPK